MGAREWCRGGCSFWFLEVLVEHHQANRTEADGTNENRSKSLRQWSKMVLEVVMTTR